MKRTKIVASVIFLTVTLLPCDLAAQAVELNTRASIWNQDDACSLSGGIRWPSGVEAKAEGTMGAADCYRLKTKYGSVVAVRVSFENPSSSQAELLFEGLSSVQVDTGESVEPALAMMWRLPSFDPIRRTMTNQPSWSDVEGTWAFPVGSGETVDLVFLFSSATVGHMVTIGSYPAQTIE